MGYIYNEMEFEYMNWGYFEGLHHAGLVCGCPRIVCGVGQNDGGEDGGADEDCPQSHEGKGEPASLENEIKLSIKYQAIAPISMTKVGRIRADDGSAKQLES